MREEKYYIIPVKINYGQDLSRYKPIKPFVTQSVSVNVANGSEQTTSMLVTID